MEETSPDKKTGWERENRTHFNDIVVNYDKARWDYPAELYADIMNYSQTENKKAVEIGAGTGKSTVPFLIAGYEVTAVEISANMAEFIKEKFNYCNNFNVLVSDFEKVVLPENSYDLVYAASAFHWVDAEIGCPKVLRLLKNGGTFALFRNNAVPEDGNELYEEIQAVYDKHYYHHYKPSPRPIRVSDMSYEDFLASAEIYRGFRFECMEDYGFKEVTMKLYKSSRMYSADEYIALIDTYSDHRALPNDDRAALYTGIKEAISRRGGQHKLNFIFQLYMGRKV
jgi:ubiquinone/menaquinone biosynthesis C-methylase UbiE